MYKIIICFFIIHYNSKSHFAYFYFRARNGLQKEHLELKQDKGHTRCKTENGELDKNSLEKIEKGKLQKFRGDIFQRHCCGDIYGEGVEIGDSEKKLFFLGRSQEEALKRLNLIQSFLSDY